MSFTLAPEAVASGYRLIAHETIGSTNADAMRRAHERAPGRLWVVSRHQSQGRGRRGNTWDSPVGNLYASLLLTPDEAPATLATLGFVAGVALVRALAEVTASRSPHGPTQTLDRKLACDESSASASQDEEAASVRPSPYRFVLKWPNDVLVGDAKLAGILLEAETMPDRRALVIGMGVNVVHAPTGLAYPTASLAGFGLKVTAETLFGALSASWAEAFATWDGGRGFAQIRDIWLRHAAGLGGPVTVRGLGAAVSGLFETIDVDGQLVVKLTDNSRRTVSAGEVHFGGAGSLRAGAAA